MDERAQGFAKPSEKNGRFSLLTFVAIGQTERKKTSAAIALLNCM
jgi:hypothetical protein